LAAPARADLVDVAELLDGLEDADERAAGVMRLKLFGGLTNDEIAVVNSVSRSTVDADYRFARAWLRRRFAKGGSP
jgi:DNA-directed RNA polymerase specialized sigma24 family protein